MVVWASDLDEVEVAISILMSLQGWGVKKKHFRYIVVLIIMTINFQTMLQSSVRNLNGILLDKMIQGSTVRFL